MKLKAWLHKRDLPQKWLAEQLGIGEPAVSQAFVKQAREGAELPRNWAADILWITGKPAIVREEWPPSRSRQSQRTTEDARAA